jgi:hypothetical protein
MKNSGVTVLLLTLCAPGSGNAQDVYRSRRSFEEQQAISQIGQAEYYARMALRSLEASEKLGKAPYFNYQSARQDIEKVLTEFKIYLKGDDSVDLQPAVPVMIDGRYFSESIKNSLTSLQTKDENPANDAVAKTNATRTAPVKTAAKNPTPVIKSAPEKETKLQQPILPPPVLVPQSDKTKREKIEEILKKGL